MPANLTVGGLLTLGGLAIALLGWGITEWVNSEESGALFDLLAPLGAIFLYGGLIMLLAGIVWYAMLYYRRSKKI